MLKHNSSVRKITKEIEYIANSAINYDDFNKALKLVQDFGQPLKYKNGILYTLASLSFSVFLLALYITYYVDYDKTWEEYHSYILVASAAMTLVSLSVCLFRRSRMKKISNKIYTGIALLDYGMHPQPLNSGIAHNNLENFVEFNRGNYSRQILYEYPTLSGTVPVFSFYKFEFVDEVETEETTTDSKGNTTTTKKTRYDHYYRYGLMTDYAYFKNIAVISSGIVPHATKYKASSIEFSKYFKLGAMNELELSKWLKPTIVELLLNARNTFKKLNIEINQQGVMCISFSDEDIINGKYRHNLESISEFLDEINEKNKLPKLGKLMTLHQNIIKYTNNNF